MATQNKEKCLLFGIDLKHSPNEEWYMQGYQESFKGKLICNFNKKVTLYGIFDGTCNAKVLDWKQINFIFDIPYDRELLASILFEIEYNFTEDGATKKNEIYIKYGSRLDLPSFSESFNYEIADCEIGSICVSTEADDKKIHIAVFTSIYDSRLDDIRSNNCELLGENPEDAYKEKPEEEKDGYYLDPSEMGSDDVQNEGNDGTCYVNVHLDDSIEALMFSSTALIWHSKSFEPMPCKLIKLDSCLSIFYGEDEDKRINIIQPKLRSFLPAGEIIDAWIVNSYSGETKSYKIKFICTKPQTCSAQRVCKFISGNEYEMDTIVPQNDRVSSICVDTTGGISTLIAAQNALRAKMGTEEGKSFILRQEYGDLVSATDMYDSTLQFMIESSVLYDYLGNGGTWLGIIDDVNIENQDKPMFKFFIVSA